jgi:hypothetical protein
VLSVNLIVVEGLNGGSRQVNLRVFDDCPPLINIISVLNKTAAGNRCYPGEYLDDLFFSNIWQESMLGLGHYSEGSCDLTDWKILYKY